MILHSSYWKLFESKIYFFHCWNEVNEHRGWVTFINIAFQESWEISCSCLWLYKIPARVIKLRPIVCPVENQVFSVALGFSSCSLWAWKSLFFFFLKTEILAKGVWMEFSQAGGSWVSSIDNKDGAKWITRHWGPQDPQFLPSANRLQRKSFEHDTSIFLPRASMSFFSY